MIFCLKLVQLLRDMVIASVDMYPVCLQCAGIEIQWFTLLPRLSHIYLENF